MDFNDIPVLVDDEEPDAKKPKLMETVDVLADFPSGLKISSIAIAANSAGLLESVSLSKKDSSWLVFRVKKPEEGASAGDCIDSICIDEEHRQKAYELLSESIYNGLSRQRSVILSLVVNDSSLFPVELKLEHSQQQLHLPNRRPRSLLATD